MTGAPVSIAGIDVTFPGHALPTLAAVTMDIDAGTARAIVGPSGSGKSTLLRVVAGLQPATRGLVHVGSVDITRLPADKRPVALVAQTPVLFPHLTIADNVAFGPRAAGVDRRRARKFALEYLDLVSLDIDPRRMPHQISGGQVQRVAFARALAIQPSVLLLDEPFNALDPQLRDEMHRLVRDIRREMNPTVCVVTHDPREATVLAEDVTVMMAGRLVQSSASPQMFAEPAAVEVFRFLGGLNEIDGRVEGGSFRSTRGAIEFPVGSSTGHCVQQGPAVAVFRQEAVRIDNVDQVRPDSAARSGGVRMTGRVVGSQVHGPRAQIDIDTEAGRIHAEVMAGSPDHGGARPGSAIGVMVPVEAVRCLPPPASHQSNILSNMQ